MTPEQLAIYRQCTGRTEPPSAPVSEGWLICGRRAGKSFALAVVAVFLACFKDWRRYLGPGERCTVMIVAADRRQARVILRYVRGLLKAVPMLAQTIEGETRESIDLRNNVTLEVHTASFRSTRGYSICAALLDELAFWRQEESTDPDSEIIAAIKPALATVPGAILLGASSPYARRGALWTAHRQHFGKDGDPVLVWHAPTRVMNPGVPQRIIDDATAADPASAAAEWMAEFRTDVESYITREAVEACVALGVRERAPWPDIHYSAFVDPSGGSADSMTLAIGHEQDDVAILDAVREVRPPFSPEDVVSEFCRLLKSYRVMAVTGDRYAGEWPRERFDAHDIKYEAAAQPKSDLYRDLLPAINSRKVDLLDHPKLVAQLCSLERRTARGGRDSIDHAPGGHDDVANGVAGLVAALAIGASSYDSSLQWVGGPGIDDDKSDWIAPPPQVNARRPRIWQPGTGWHEAADSRDANVASDSAPPSWAARRSLWNCYPMFGANMHWSYRGRHR
jgi:terminase large subunit-like protein